MVPRPASPALLLVALSTATILGAGKVTGRTDGGWSVGFLEAVTARETARYTDAGGTVGREVVSPLTNYFVGRIRRTMAEERPVMGGMATAGRPATRRRCA